MKHHQRGHCEVEYDGIEPVASMWVGIAICAFGLGLVVVSVGWLAAVGVTFAMWGYKLQIDGSVKLERERNAGVEGNGTRGCAPQQEGAQRTP